MYGEGGDIECTIQPYITVPQNEINRQWWDGCREAEVGWAVYWVDQYKLWREGWVF